MLPDHLTLPEPPEPLARRLAAGAAIAWREPVTMRTYEPAPPDRFPMYLQRRVYQGSNGRVYPLPFIDRIAHEPVARTWDAIHLENRWLRVMVLPELGGRIHVAYDKTAGYDFFYRNNVIKPALVGLAGPWVSGGVEFNWPQHHRPATYLAVETTIDESEGSVVVWCSDHDPFTRMKGMHGIRLWDDRAVLDLDVRLHNRTSQVQSFLWWANVAVAVHDEYQSFFPTDVHYVADHARRAITAFPAADRPYYGVDYPARADTGGDRLDFYRNIPVPTSYMVTDTVDDFFGGYDHRAGAGFVHVADHRIAPGKKQWTWGDSPFGHTWDRLLTDHDGPYIELMAGVYTDNQPDFSWLQPGETKAFTQTWYPIQQIGPVQQANESVAVRLDVRHGWISLGLCVTEELPAATVRVTLGDAVVADRTVDLRPGEPLLWDIAAPGAHLQDTVVTVTQDKTEIIRWQPRPVELGSEPWQAAEPLKPADIETVEELYLTGIHLAQYRHPTRAPDAYWAEALRRDPGHAPTHVALADDRLRRGLYHEAEEHARAAVERLTIRNANPRDGEASYLLGLALVRQGRPEEAYEALAKASWDGRWAAPALVELARLDAQAGRWTAAESRAAAACRLSPADSRARTLRVFALRRLNREPEAAGVLAQWLSDDPLDQVARELDRRPRSTDGRTLLDVAAELGAAGDWSGAEVVLTAAEQSPVTPAGDIRPMAAYRLAVVLDRLGRPSDAAAARQRARAADGQWCFPCGSVDQAALESALAADPDDDRAASLLGMLLYDAGRQREALDLWLRVVERDTVDVVTWRNAAVALVNCQGDDERALQLFDRAIAQEKLPRLLYERDQLLARSSSAEHRLALLDDARTEVLQRDDLTVAYCRLLVEVGRAGEALTVLQKRQFAPFEGGEGQVIAAWEAAALALADRAAAEGDPAGAAALVRRAIDVPDNLGEVRHPLTDTRALHDRLADLLDRGGRSDEAAEVRAQAVVSDTLPCAASVEDADVDYFATSLPDLLLFPRPVRERKA